MSISQIEATEKLGISQQAVSNLLSSTNDVRPSTKQKVFKTFPNFEKYYNNKLNTSKNIPEVVQQNSYIQ